MKVLLSLLTMYTTAAVPNMDKLFLAWICQEECEFGVQFLDSYPNAPDPLFSMHLSSSNGTLQETTIDIDSNVRIIQFQFDYFDENGTFLVPDAWNLDQTDTYFHRIGPLQIVGNLPCGKYGCPQAAHLCNSNCRFTVIISLAAFCILILAGLVLQTAYVSYLSFRRTRKELELRDALRLVEQ